MTMYFFCIIVLVFIYYIDFEKLKSNKFNIIDWHIEKEMKKK